MGLERNSSPGSERERERKKEREREKRVVQLKENPDSPRGRTHDF